MDNREKIEKIFELYYKQPFQLRIVMDSVKAISTEQLGSIIVKEIVPNVFTFLNDKEKMRKEKEISYIREVVNALVDSNFLSLKKKSYKEFIKHSLHPPESAHKTNEDYLREHKEYLKSVMLPSENKRNYTKME